MDEKRFDQVIEELPRTFRPMGEAPAPYDEMWKNIEAAHFDAQARNVLVRRRALSFVPWLAAAATLLIGIAIGRSTGANRAAVQSDPSVASTASAQTPSSPQPTADAFRDETTRYFEQVTGLLIALPNPTGPDRFASASGNSQLAGKASDLLVTTRLLLDSPAAQDSKLHGLLEDLELVLAQIARLHGPQSRSDLDLIQQAVQQGDVLSRLNSAVATNPSAE